LPELPRPKRPKRWNWRRQSAFLAKTHGAIIKTHGAIMEVCMSATGLDVFDKTLQTTHIWLDEIMAKLGPDRQVAWHVLGAVLHALRDRLPIGLAVHLGAQLPLLVRGLYYDQWHPSEQTLKERSAEQFLEHVSQRLRDIRPVNVVDATQATFQVLNHHVDPHQIEKVLRALPENIRALWPTGAEGRRFEPAA
jgi:uncharacterized protein (DUF2267 family)